MGSCLMLEYQKSSAAHALLSYEVLHSACLLRQ
jgi:hypothetical protein